MSEIINRIRQKVKARGLKLNPVISEEEVTVFEKRHHITLPSDYRLFITTVGNGGEGPAEYGVLPLGEVPSDFNFQERRFWSEIPCVSKPFPFTHAWIWEAEQETTEGTDEHVNLGSIVLGTDGCGMYWHLIITGPDRGILWQICGEGIQPVCPKRGFAQWYEDWLNGLDSFYGYVDLGT